MRVQRGVLLFRDFRSFRPAIPPSLGGRMPQAVDVQVLRQNRISAYPAKTSASTPKMSQRFDGPDSLGVSTSSEAPGAAAAVSFAALAVSYHQVSSMPRS